MNPEDQLEYDATLMLIADVFNIEFDAVESKFKAAGLTDLETIDERIDEISETLADATAEDGDECEEE